MGILKEAMMNVDKSFEEEIAESMKELDTTHVEPDTGQRTDEPRKPVLRAVKREEPEQKYQQQESRVHREGQPRATVVQTIKPNETRFQVGEYKGMTKEEAVNKELSLHRRSPSRRIMDLQEATKNSIRSLELAKDEIVAEYKVEKTNNITAFEQRGENMRAQVAQLHEQISHLQEQITLNDTEKQNRGADIDSHYKLELASLDNMIESQRLMLSNLSKSSQSIEQPSKELIDHSDDPDSK